MDDKLWSTRSAKALKYSSSSVTSLISSDVMQPGMSINDSIALMVIQMSHISLSLFGLWLYQDSQSAINSCGPGFHSILI